MQTFLPHLPHNALLIIRNWGDGIDFADVSQLMVEHGRQMVMLEFAQHLAASVRVFVHATNTQATRFVPPKPTVPVTPKPKATFPMTVTRAIYTLQSSEDAVFNDVTELVKGLVRYDSDTNTDIIDLSSVCGWWVICVFVQVCAWRL